MGSEKCFNAEKFFFFFFLDKGKIQGYLPPNVGVPTPKFRRGFNKKNEFFVIFGGWHQRVEKNFFAFLDDSDHV